MKQVQFVGDGLNPTDRATLLSLAEMAADAYVRLPDPSRIQIPSLSTLLTSSSFVDNEFVKRETEVPLKETIM